MDKKQQQLSIRVNGEKYNHHEREKESAREEVAAALDRRSESFSDKEKENDKNLDDIPEVKILQRPYKNKKSLFSKIPSIKHLLIAGLSATFVGIIMGFVMLKLLSGVGTEETVQPANNNGGEGTANVGSNEDDETTGNPSEDNVDLVPITVDGFTPYIVQVGRFTTKEKAEEWEGKFLDKGIDPFIWESNGEFILFAGIGLSKDAAKQLELDIENAGFTPEDAFVKEWPILGKEKNLVDEEGTWVKNGLDTWKEVVPSFSTNEAQAIEKLTAWYDAKPASLSSEGQELANNMDQYLETLTSNSNKWSKQNSLISILYTFENFLSE
ncbi:hypothetical protein HNQ94_000345 [Salirhabdus euzebyi]|uniref:SPOR domain-containing protein n=1 Tax=Salirhabdus euzebyi TaxID=394506 RepID=A0A841PVX8_9BACI|nr:SPOR domain-containing protein [Salirhabdus euzebyi]MBB6451924.1 hypothetical protein [Salirhabdus euzebyi]